MKPSETAKVFTEYIEEATTPKCLKVQSIFNQFSINFQSIFNQLACPAL